MLINKEDWEAVGNQRKEETRRCEVCGKQLEPSELCARHLQYGDEVEDKFMLIVCKDCNYKFHLAENNEIEKLSKLNDNTLKEFRELEKKFFADVVNPVMQKYMQERAAITSEAIINAVGKNRTGKRPLIDMLFKYPKLEDDDKVISLCKKAGAWDGSKYAPMTKNMKEEKK